MKKLLGFVLGAAIGSSLLPVMLHLQTAVLVAIFMVIDVTMAVWGIADSFRPAEVWRRHLPAWNVLAGLGIVVTMAIAIVHQ